MIWSTKKIKQCAINASLWTQPPFSAEVESPLFVFAKPKVGRPENVYARLDTAHIMQDEPLHVTVQVGWMQKKGAHNRAAKKRFFILTSGLDLFYYENDECRVLKGQIDLKTMEKVVVSSKNASWIYVHTPGRKWVLQCGSNQMATQWKDLIQQLRILSLSLSFSSGVSDVVWRLFFA